MPPTIKNPPKKNKSHISDDDTSYEDESESEVSSSQDTHKKKKRKNDNNDNSFFFKRQRLIKDDPIQEIKNKIKNSKMLPSVKAQAYELIEHADPSSMQKQISWVTTLLKIPWNKYSKLPILKTSSTENIQKYFESANNLLNTTVHGMENVKEEIINYISQCISTNSTCMPRILGLSGEPGIGKCFQKGTKILMYSGKIKNVENIQVGDMLMGDDSTPRNVITLGTGEDIMYEITNIIGEKYVVNSQHILCLYYENSKNIIDNNTKFVINWFDNINIIIKSKDFFYTKENKNIILIEAMNCLNNIKNNNICEITVTNYLDLPTNIQHKLKGYSTPVDFPDTLQPYNPYTIGLLLLNVTECTTNKEEVLYLNSFFKNESIYIPHIYKCNSKENRLKLLAGILDSNLNFKHTKKGFCYNILKSNTLLINDILYLCKSLGFTCYTEYHINICNIFIYGIGIENIPLLTKKSFKRQTNNSLISSIKITKLTKSKYYGFTIDNNERFVLGNFIVTHNTRIIRSGLAPALLRPIKYISMGGIRDSNHFNGFDLTYTGSRPGLIVQSLIDCGVMDPIIFMDELDKISETPEGVEIQNLLIHLTDPVQNSTFQDKYFAGINIDLSKVIFIFSYNDEKKISPVLKDRIYNIKVPIPSNNSKIIIGKLFLTKEIAPNIGFKVDDIVFPDTVLQYILTTYCYGEKGIRSLKKIMETLYLKINTAKYLKTQKYKSLTNLTFPLTVTEKIVSECIPRVDNESYDYIMRHMYL